MSKIHAIHHKHFCFSSDHFTCPLFSHITIDDTISLYSDNNHNIHDLWLIIIRPRASLMSNSVNCIIETLFIADCELDYWQNMVVMLCTSANRLPCFPWTTPRNVQLSTEPFHSLRRLKQANLYPSVDHG